MVSHKNHRPMSQPERALWRDVLVALLTFSPIDLSHEKAVGDAADLADKAVAEYRKRITWRQS